MADAGTVLTRVLHTGSTVSADIDFYVEESRAADAIGLLKTHGYTEPEDPWFYEKRLIEESHHFPPLIHPDHIASIEVHRHAT